MPNEEEAMSSNKKVQLFSFLATIIVISILALSQFGGTIYKVSAQGTGTVSGTIRDAEGNPAGGIQVRAVYKSDGTDADSTTSDPVTGEYTLLNVPHDYDIAVVADGSFNFYYDSVAELPWAQIIHLDSGTPDMANVDIVVDPFTTVMEHLVFNFDAGRITADLAVRQAIAYGTDRQMILDSTFRSNGSSGEVLNAMVPPEMPYAAAASDPSLTLYGYEVTTAEDILDTAGWVDTNANDIRDKGGVELILDMLVWSKPYRDDAALLFQSQMADIGIQVDITFLDGTTFFGEMNAGNFDIAEFAWSTYLNDNLLSTYNSGNPTNYGSYNNATLDGYYEDARSAKEVGNYGDFNAGAKNWQYESSADLPVLPLFTRTVTPVERIFNVQPDHGWVTGWNWTVGNTVNIYVDDDTDLGNGTLYTDSTTVDGDGFFNFQVEPAIDLQPNQYITVDDGLTLKTTQIVEVHFDSIDQTAHTASGRGPAGWPNQADFYINSSGGELNFLTPIDGSGNWSADITGHDTDIQDAHIRIPDDDGDGTVAHFRMPGFNAWFNQDDRIEGWDWPGGSRVDVLIHDASADVDYSIDDIDTDPCDHDGSVGCFSADLTGILDLEVGDTVTVRLDDGTFAKTTTVADLNINLVAIDSDGAGGIAPSGSDVAFWACDESICYEERYTTSTGTWWVTYDAHDIVPGNFVGARVQDIDGDGTAYGLNIYNPFIEASPGSQWIHARNWPLGTEVSMTINAMDGGLPDDWTDTATMVQAPWNPGDPNDIVADFPWPDIGLESGWIIAMTGSAQGIEITKVLTVSSLAVTSQDLDLETVSGSSNPDASVDVCINFPDHCAIRHLSADGSGDWISDYAIPGPGDDETETVDITTDTDGWAAEYDGDGDQTWVDWHVLNPTFAVQPDHNWLAGWDWTPGNTLLVIVDETETPAEPYLFHDDSSFTIEGDGSFWIGLDPGGEFDLEPGQYVILDDGVTTKTLLIQEVYFDSINQTTDIAAGRGPASWPYDVTVYIEAEGNEGVDQTTINASGGWTADFAGDIGYDIQEFQGARVEVSDDDGDLTVAHFNVPTFQARMTENQVHGYYWEIGRQVTLDIYDFEGGSQIYGNHMDPEISGWDPNMTFVQFTLGGFTLQPGQFITMDNGKITRTLTVTDLEVTDVNPDLDTVSGTSSSDLPIEVGQLCDPGGCTVRRTTQSGGSWSVDFSVPGAEGDEQYLYDIKFGDESEARQNDSDGDATQYGWNVPYPPVHNVTQDLYYATIQSAIDAATPGDTINVAAGTYPENVNINKAVTLTGENKDTTIIDGSGSGVVVAISASNAAMSGFTVTNSGSGGTDAGVLFYNVSGSTVSGNIISNNNASGIGVIMGSGNFITANTVETNAAYGVVIVASTGNTIDLNTISGNGLDAIALANAGEIGGDVAVGSTGNFIKGNTISSNRDGIFLGENCDNNQITEGNLISGVTSIGISLWRSGGHTITDNGINTTLTGIRLLGSSDNTINLNAVVANGTGIIVDPSWQVGVWYESLNNTISGNNISGNTNGFVIGDLVHQTTTVIAESNWWGDISGPSGEGSGSGDAVSTNVDYTPWCTDVHCTQLWPIVLISPTGAQSPWNNTFNWTGVTGATHYYLEVRKTSDMSVIYGHWYLVADACSGLDCSVSPTQTALLPAGDYQWRVKDWSAAGQSPWTSYMTFSIPAPAVITLVSPSGLQDPWLNTFEWTGIPSSTHYYLEVRKTSDMAVVYGHWYTIASVCSGLNCSVSPTQTALLPAGDYQWHVKDWSAAGQSPWTEYMTFSIPAPAVITLVSPSGLQDPWGNTFNWTGISSSTHYYLEVRKTSDMSVIYGHWYMVGDACSGLDCSVSPTQTALLPAGDYQWHVKDWSAAGQGPWTSYMTFSIPAPAVIVLGSPNGLQDPWGNTFNWTGIPSSTHYYLEVRKTSDMSVVLGQWYTIASVCSGLDCSVSPAQTLALAAGNYQWRIKDWSAAGQGPWTEYMTFSIPAPAVITLISPTGVQSPWTNTFTWTGISSSTHYYIEVRRTSDMAVVYGHWYTIASVCSGLNCSVSPAQTLALPSGGYQWRIKDWSAAGQGPWTSYMAFSIP